MNPLLASIFIRICKELNIRDAEDVLECPLCGRPMKFIDMTRQYVCPIDGYFNEGDI